MDSIKRIVGVLLVVHGVACGGFTIIEHLFQSATGLADSGLGYSPVWLYLDPGTAMGIALGLAFAWRGKLAMQRERQGGGDGNGGGITRGYLEANARFYGFLFVAILFYRLFFGDLTGSNTLPDAADVEWSIVYGLYPLLAASLGVGLMRGRG